MLNFTKDILFKVFFEISIFKYKHNCFIVSRNGKIPFDVFLFDNTMAGFNIFLNKINFLYSTKEMRTWFG